MSVALAAARRAWGWTLRLGIVLILLAAVLVSAGRWLLPSLADYRTAIAQRAGDYLHARVGIAGLTAAWEGWSPVVRLSGVELYGLDGGPPVATVAHALARLDMPRSLLAGRPVLGRLRLEGVRLSLKRDAGGALYLLPPDAGAPPVPLQQLAVWLLDTGSLDVASADVTVRAQDGGAPLVFTDIRLSLGSGGGERRLGLALTLPARLGRELRAAAALRGEADDPASWHAGFYAKGEALELAGWPLPVALGGGRVGVEVWGDWQDGALADVLGRLRASDLAPPERPNGAPLGRLLAGLTELAGDFAWRRSADGWQWRSDWTATDARGQPVLQIPLDLGLREDGATRLLEGRLGDLPVEDLAAALLPWLDEGEGAVLAGLAPTGEMVEATFRIALDGGDGFTTVLPDGWPMTVGRIFPPLGKGGTSGQPSQPVRFALAARIAGLATRPWRRVPGLSGLDAVVALDQDGGRLDLEGEGLDLDAIGLLRAPIRLNTLAGAVRWRREAAGLRFETTGLSLANADLRARLSGAVTLDGGSPLLDLGLDYRDLNLGEVRRYLPAAVMRPKLVEWLDRALAGGQVAAGDLVFWGRLADFPFDHGEGLFETRFRVRDAVLDYSPGWPRIEALQAEVAFRNRSLRIEGSSGRIFDVRLRRIEGRIDDLDRGVLEVQGHARGPTAGMLRFLQESPLRQRVGDYLQDMRATGRNSLDLALSIPLNPDPNRVKGTVGFSGSTLALPAWNVEFADIRGDLDFTEAGLAARDLKLRFRGEPVSLAIESGELRIGAGDASLPQAPGLAVVAHLPRWELARAVSGATGAMHLPPWLGSLDVRIDEFVVRGQRFRGVRLAATRRGRGLAVTLQGEDLAGDLTLPAAPDVDNPVQAMLSRLALRRDMDTQAGGTAEALDPRSVPPLALEVETVLLDGKPLGRLGLSTSPRPDGLQIRTLALRSELHQLSGAGEWVVTGEGQRSRLQGTLHTRSLAETLNILGFTSELERGETDIELTLSWPGPLIDPAPGLLDGHVSLHVGKGQLLDVDPGVGRFMGLFSLSTLSRRLALDFSDLFDKGLGFDRIDGTFTLQQGEAHTTDLILDGPSADLHIEGRLGLAARDCDLVVTVVPRVGVALPIAGAIAGGPAVGAALLVADWLLKEGIDHAARYRYAVTGPWNAPVVERIRSPAASDEPPPVGNR